MPIPSNSLGRFPKRVVQEGPSGWAGGPRARVDDTLPKRLGPGYGGPRLIAGSRASIALHNV
eukprot:2827074-Pyramimonas_sp.AAC.1